MLDTQNNNTPNYYDMKKFVFFAAAAAMLVLVSCSKDNGGGKQEENPNPTQITSFGLYKADIEVDPEGFNMLSDGGFENFQGDEDWKSKSLWYLPEYISEAETPLTGNRSISADCNLDGWRDCCLQSICVKKDQSYTLSLWYRGAWKGLNVYMGFRGADPHDQNTNNPDGNDSWAEYTFSYSNTDETQLTAFMGGWCWYDLWIEADDFKVVPTGSNNDSFVLSNVSEYSKSIKNVSFNDVSSADKIVAWTNEDGSVSAVLQNAKIGNAVVGNSYATGPAFSPSEMKLATVGTESITTESNAVPTSGVMVGGTQYLHYYKYAGAGTPTEEDPDPDWIASGSAIIASSDGGKTWSETGLSWGADSKFIKASFCKNKGYIYMFGSEAGDKNVLTYVARVKEENFATVSGYEYWDGLEWVKGDESIAAPVIYGPIDCMGVVYNASRYTYMMIYRSRTSGRLVYRDAGLPEGEWSGEKLLCADPEEGALLHAPQILSVSNNEIYFLTSYRNE